MNINGDPICPVCRETGHKVKQVTLQSLLREQAVQKLSGEQYYFCDNPRCNVVYYSAAGAVFDRDDLAVRVGIKESDPPRYLCYCFEHTVEEIEEQVAATGTSTVGDDIALRMKNGCWCETKNPAGRCCLATVKKYTQQARLAAGFETGEEDKATEESPDCCGGGCADCCSMETRENTGEKGALLAVGGSVITAVLSSACCWIPLLLLVFGASAAGVSAFFEKWRPYFLVASVLLLGMGFYFAYFRQNTCSSACCTAAGGRRLKFSRAMLWISAAAVAVFAAFPRYVGLLVPGNTAITITADREGQARVTFPVSGMTCETCTINIRNKLMTTEGVLDAAVSYKEGKAEIRYDRSAPPSRAALKKAVADAGYEAGDINIPSEADE